MIENFDVIAQLRTMGGFGDMWYLNPREFVKKNQIFEDKYSYVDLKITPISLIGHAYLLHQYSKGIGEICPKPQSQDPKNCSCRSCEKGNRPKQYVLYYVWEWVHMSPIVMVVDRRLTESMESLMVKKEDFLQEGKYYDKSGLIRLESFIVEKLDGLKFAAPIIDIRIKMKNEELVLPGAVKYEYELTTQNIPKSSIPQTSEDLMKIFERLNPLFRRENKNGRKILNKNFNFWEHYLEEWNKTKELRKQGHQKQVESSDERTNN